jgi:UDP-glucose 4-epimerase
VRQICNAVAEITGRKIPMRVGERREGDPPVLCASPRRIMAELDWKPEHSSLTGILMSAWQWKLKQLSVCDPASSR